MSPASPTVTGPVRIFLSTGELSGDYHAMHLVKALRVAAGTRGLPLEIAASGSHHLRAVVDDLWEETADWAGIGILDSLRVGPTVALGCRRIMQRMQRWQPHLVIGVDYRVANLRLLQAAHKQGARTAYYFPPVHWGSTNSKARKALVQVYEGKGGERRKPDRFDRIAACTDLVLLTYPISEGEYRRAGANVHYIGHPLWNALQTELITPADEVRAGFGLPPASDAPAAPLLVGLFPGSRTQELRDIWPVMRDWLRQYGSDWPQVTWLVSVAHPRYRSHLVADIDRFPAALRSRVRLIEGMAPDQLRAMDLVLMKSGTAAQTALLLGLPMVACYRIGMPPVLGPLILALSRQLFLNLPFYTFPNLLAERALVPELIQEACTVAGLQAAVAPLLSDPAARGAQRAALLELHDQLVRPEALSRAASMLLDLVAPSGSGADA